MLSSLEYTGELIYEDTVSSREYVPRSRNWFRPTLLITDDGSSKLASHRGRCYLFEVDSNLGIDSSFFGNPSRYINHGEEGANCAANSEYNTHPLLSPLRMGLS